MVKIKVVEGGNGYAYATFGENNSSLFTAYNCTDKEKCKVLAEMINLYNDSFPNEPTHVDADVLNAEALLAFAQHRLKTITESKQNQAEK